MLKISQEPSFNSYTNREYNANNPTRSILIKFSKLHANINAADFF